MLASFIHFLRWSVVKFVNFTHLPATIVASIAKLFAVNLLNQTKS